VAILSTDVPYLYIAEGAEQHAKRLGFEVIPIITIEKGDNLSSILSDLKDDRPNMVLFSAPFGEALSFVKTAKAVGLSPKMFGIIVAPCDPTFVEQLGKDADYIFGPCQWTSDLPYDGPVFGSSEDYARLFSDKFGKVPEYHSAAASACGVTYQLALEKASSLDREKVRDALVSLDAMTFYGWIKFNEQGRDIYNSMVAVQVQKGKTVAVWPERLATGSPIYPTPPWEEREPGLKVAVLHFGPIGDYGWTYEAHLGAQAMAEALPYVELSERENASGPDSPQILREYAEAGYGVTFCHGWDLGIKEVAPNYPDVIFMWGAGVEKKAPNTGIYYGRMYEASFLAGIVAGAMTETNMIGYAAALPIPEVVMGIDAFAKGVASVNPDAKVYVEWIGDWYNPPKEKEVTLSLIDRGCDVITHHSDSYAPGETAEERGVNYISFGSDMRRFAPHVFLTGTVWNWAPIMSDVVKAVREGTWDEHPGQDWWYGLAEGGVKLAPFSDLVPGDVREMVEKKKQAIVEGEFEVFPGMTDEELREIYYFEPNVVGEFPVKEAEEAIKIGAIYPLTGSLATSGADVKNGILLAVDIINNEHKMDLPLARSKGIDSLDGAKIEIVFGDSQGLPSTGKSEAERLIDREKVVALIGCYQSAVTAEASQVAEDKGIPFLSATSTAPCLTQQGHLYFFRTTPDDKIFVQNFYEFLQDVQEDKDIKVDTL
jgi:basic membrane protein A